MSDTLFTNSSLPALTGPPDTPSTLMSHDICVLLGLCVSVLPAFLNQNLYFFHLCVPTVQSVAKGKLVSEFLQLIFFRVCVLLSCTFLVLVVFCDKKAEQRGVSLVGALSPFLCLCFLVFSGPGFPKGKGTVVSIETPLKPPVLSTAG